MSSIPGNVFDYSIPLRPGHLPGIQPATGGYMPVDRHIAYRSRPTDEHGWTTVSRGRKAGGWQGRKARAVTDAVKNMIVM
jgi:hypothetical protein